MIKLDEDPYLSFEGPFNIEIISTLAKFLSEGPVASVHVRKKLCKVFIELVQNVAKYSFNRIQMHNGFWVGTGKVFVLNDPDTFKCGTINKIQVEHAPILVKNCTEINHSDRQTLRERKNNLRRLASIKDTGAHIGLIMISLYSENQLDFEIIEDNNDLYFKLIATLKNI